MALELGRRKPLEVAQLLPLAETPVRRFVRRMLPFRVMQVQESPVERRSELEVPLPSDQVVRRPAFRVERPLQLGRPLEKRVARRPLQLA